MEPNTIYLLCQANGGCEYERIDDSTFTPMYAEIPKSIDYINIITYAPHGCCNVVDIMSTWSRLNYFIEHSQEYNTKYGEQLVDFIKQNPSISECNIMDKENAIHDEKLDFVRADTYIYKQNPQHIYNQIEYNRENQQLIPYKRWRIYFPESFVAKFSERLYNDNLYVVSENNGELPVGTKFLNEQSPETNTNDLLQFLSNKGYTRIILIDYSCDVCITKNREKVPRRPIIDERKRRTLKGGKLRRISGYKKTSKTRKYRSKYRNKRQYSKFKKRKSQTK
tara:strand:- start:2310 stop:3149 length:840 start_codon:yes stop_codon:yes gene_type:complete